MEKPARGPNGGAREGAGRPPKPPQLTPTTVEQPEQTPAARAEAASQLLMAMALDTGVDVAQRIAAAKALLPAAKVGTTKREKKADEAAQALGGKFAPRTAPRLVAGG